MKVLNLYAGIGGNRKLWKGVEVTAIENNEIIAEIYQRNFPEDKVIVADAHQYLLDHYKEYDFIWSSPPCPTHSRTNTFLNAQGFIRYPDMQLYQEIIFLSQWFKGKWVVENVISYYDPLIKPYLCGRHYFWANFVIPHKEFEVSIGTFNRNASLSKQMKIANVLGTGNRYGFDVRDATLDNKRQVLRNLVNPELGLYVFKMAFKEKQTNLISTTEKYIYP